ncbi:MAG TPA: hypothetical protein DEB40_11630 [Elusimicrobia bacterium]|nr:hypothetical protein [Elusimicrobiota bacterium]HBT62383.1 hypothetical protein [Elusimicrobiota bacterium]
MAQRPVLVYILALIVLELVSFGFFAHRMGFYQDDWSTAEFCLHAADKSLFGMVRAFNDNMVRNGTAWYIRPVNILYYPLLCWGGKLAFWRYQAAIMAQEALIAVFLFLALRLANGGIGLPLLTAGLFLIFPNHGATHHWYSAAVTPAMAFCAAAFWAYAAWLERKRPWLLGGSLALFMLAALSYEAVVPLALFFPFLGFMRDRRLAVPGQGAWAMAAKRFAPFGAAIVMLMLYHQGVQAWGPRSLPRRMAFDPLFILQVLGKGVECNTSAVIDLCRRYLLDARSHFYLGQWAAAILSGGIAAMVFERAHAQQEDRLDWAWPLGALGLLLAANLPYALSADRYMPHVFDVQNRVNMAPSLAGAMLWAWALWESPRLAPRWARSMRMGLVGLVVSGFTIANWHNAWQWSESWRLQREVLDGIKNAGSTLPEGPVVVILDGAPSEVGQVPVFNESHAFDPALKLWLGRQDVIGTIMTPMGPQRIFPGEYPRFLYDFRDARLDKVLAVKS